MSKNTSKILLLKANSTAFSEPCLEAILHFFPQSPLNHPAFFCKQAWLCSKETDCLQERNACGQEAACCCPVGTMWAGILGDTLPYNQIKVRENCSFGI